LFGIIEAQCGPRSPNVCDEFFKLSAQQQEIEFRKFPVDKQLIIYRCGMTLHPKTIGFAYLIADGGAKNIPILMESLKREPDESIRADIIYVFEVLADHGELKGRPDVVRQLQVLVSGMHAGPRERAEASLAKIAKAAI